MNKLPLGKKTRSEYICKQIHRVSILTGYSWFGFIFCVYEFVECSFYPTKVSWYFDTWYYDKRLIDYHLHETNLLSEININGEFWLPAIDTNYRVDFSSNCVIFFFFSYFDEKELFLFKLLSKEKEPIYSQMVFSCRFYSQ